MSVTKYAPMKFFIEKNEDIGLLRWFFDEREFWNRSKVYDGFFRVNSVSGWVGDNAEVIFVRTET